MAGRKWRHGLAGSRVYQLWAQMKYRCESVEHYVSRGIMYVADWGEFIPFHQWALANGYRDDLELDRIDNAKGYAPDNCRWVERSVNCNNRAVTHFFEAFGETKAAADWARDPRCVVKRSTLQRRVKDFNWDGEAAMTTPARIQP